MRNRLFKISIIGVCCALFVLFGLDGTPADAFSGGPPPARTGAPALGSFMAEPTCTLCHTSFPLNSGPGMLTVTGLPANYSSNQEVTVTVTLSQPDRVRYGFEATVLDDQGRKAGDLIVTDAARTRTVDGTGNFAGRQYIQQILAGTTPNGTNQNSWTFTWRAPAQSVGRVTFYVAGNAGNGASGNQGDFIYNINASVQPPASLPNFASVSAASFAPTGPLAANGIAAGFGSGLSQNVVSATMLPLPTQLDGTEVRVRDAGGTERPAGLFFVGPGQINYLIPAGTSNGNATITVRRSGADVAQGTVAIDTVAPGLFAANANGQGVAAAIVFRRRGTVDTTEPVAQFNSQTNRFEPRPIDLGPETDQVFLIAFGSGIRGVSSLSMATSTIGGAPAEVIFAGATPGFEGLDQANIRINRSLMGRGLVDVVFSADGKMSNTLQINVR